jgi:hypothetical protein
MSNTPIFDSLAEEHNNDAVNGLVLQEYLNDWYRDRGYFDD